MTKVKSKAKVKANAMPVLAKKTLEQADVPAMLEAVNLKIAELKGSNENAKQTNGNLDGFGDINSIDLPENLIRAQASVNSREKAYNEAMDDLEVSEPKFKVSGGTADQWLIDIKNRLNVVTHKVELGKLEKIKGELSQHLSVEEKLNQSLLNIQGILLS